MKVLLDAADLQQEPYQLSRHAAYSLLHQIGVRITPRRLVVLRDRLEEHLGGGNIVEKESGGPQRKAPP